MNVFCNLLFKIKLRKIKIRKNMYWTVQLYFLLLHALLKADKAGFEAELSIREEINQKKIFPIVSASFN